MSRSKRSRRAAARWPLRRWAVLALVLLSQTFEAAVAPAQRTASEHELKAAFLYNFARFVRWPESAPKDVFAICVHNSEPLLQELQRTVAGKQANEMPLAIRSVSDAAAMRGCRILYVGPCAPEQERELLAALQGASVLTTSDRSGFARRGGIVEFRRDENRLRLDINLHQADEARLKISSQLLKLARIVNP